jgi:hypothetical protein
MFRRGLRLLVSGVETDVLFGAFSPGDVPGYDGTQVAGRYDATGFNTATQVSAVTTLADVTNHTFALVRTGIYYFRFTGAYRTDATTTGLRFSANFSGTATNFSGALSVETGAAGGAEQYFTGAINTAIGSATGPGAVDQKFVYWGRIGISTPGTFAFRIASEIAVANGVTLALGAISEVWQ